MRLNSPSWMIQLSATVTEGKLGAPKPPSPPKHTRINDIFRSNRTHQVVFSLSGLSLAGSKAATLRFTLTAKFYF